MIEDKIVIKGLEVYARHGVLAEEQELGQKFIIDAVLCMDLRAAGANDDISRTVNYADVCEDLIKWMQKKSFCLIESAAAYIAESVLIKYRKVARVEIDLKKPSAPLAFHIDTVMVHTVRERHTAYIAIGSNIGDRAGLISRAIQLVDLSPRTDVIQVSGIYETEAYGYTDQPPFLNGCFEVSTICMPDELLGELHQVEDALGRKREIRWGPRTMDLDIIFYDNEVIDTKDLHIPHIDMHNRLFVLKPLSDIAGFVRHPLIGKTVDQLLAELGDSKRS